MDHCLIVTVFILIYTRHGDAGQICASCTDIDRPDDCQHHVKCTPDENCYIRQYINESGANLYDLGCISSQVCRYSNQAIVGKRFEGLHFRCLSCCNEYPLCNQISECIATESEKRQVCASCSRLTNPADCQYHALCATDEVCYIHKYVTDLGNAFYDLGCMYKKVCPLSSNINLGRGSAEDHHFKCIACCHNNNMCNLNITCGINTLATNATTSTIATISTTSAERLARDCSELEISRQSNGSYTIYPYGSSGSGVSVYCEFNIDGIWTVIQRRFNGSVDFYRNWTEYKNGFGSSSGEYWVGNDVLHQLTGSEHYELKIILKDWDNVTKYALYTTFSVADEADQYRLTVTGFSGDAGDAMTLHNRMMFSTLDRDNDAFSGSVGVNHCAQYYKGGWWYFKCLTANLNGHYYHYSHSRIVGVTWNPWHGYQYSLKETSMMIKRK